MVQDIEAFYYLCHNNVSMFTIVFGYDRTKLHFCSWACIGDINGTHNSAWVPTVKAMSLSCRNRINEII